MRIEVFSEAKDPRAPDANEDSFVILPGRAYAVMDGVSDRTGIRYDGMLAGRLAAQLVARTLERMLTADGHATHAGDIIRSLTTAIADAYRRHGVLERARANAACRFSSTLALVLTSEEHVQLVLVGDSGARLNGTAIRWPHKDLDLITSTLRQRAWLVLAERGTEAGQREALSRRVTMHGTGQSTGDLEPFLNAADLARIADDTIARCAAGLPHVPPGDIEALVRAGIVNGQGRYQNNATAVLGYSCLDGFPVPDHLVHIETLPCAGITSIELFSDGYYLPGDGFGIGAWEAAFRHTEEQDPAKVELYLAPKGSGDGVWSDDRTYLGVEL